MKSKNEAKVFDALRLAQRVAKLIPPDVSI